MQPKWEQYGLNLLDERHLCRVRVEIKLTYIQTHFHSTLQSIASKIRRTLERKKREHTKTRMRVNAYDKELDDRLRERKREEETNEDIFLVKSVYVYKTLNSPDGI
jgi:septal ring factor EnvC (AmiA/AmiB activator)